MNKSERVRQYVEQKIRSLMAEADSGGGKALFASLRKGLGRDPGELPELWGLLFAGMPEDFYGDGVPSHEEWAGYLALTFYALHQQGHDVKQSPMHVKDVGVGQALYRLASRESDDNADERIIRRLKSISSSKDIKEVGYLFRQIIKLLRAESIPLDYSLLASDLYNCQFEESSSKVHLRWGQEYYLYKSREKHEEEK